MPFLPLEGVVVYNQQEPTDQASEKVARYLRANHDGARRAIIRLSVAVFWLALGTAMGYAVFGAYLPGLYALPLGAFFVRVIGILLEIRDGHIKKARKRVFAGKYRAHYVVPINYSFTAVLSPEMREAMQDPERGREVSERVDHLFRNIETERLDELAASDRSSITHIGLRREGREGLIEMAERLSEGLGIEQADHFRELRKGSEKLFSKDLARAQKEQDAKSEELNKLRQLR